MNWNKLSWAAAVAGTLIGAKARAAIIADSVKDFSLTQGQNNWWYGYWDRTNDGDKIFVPSELTLFPKHDATHWYINDNVAPGQKAYYTALDALQQHPNSVNTSRGREAVEHWVIRRYVSPVAGRVVINGETQEDTDVGGDGVTALILVDGAMAYSRAVRPNDITGLKFSSIADVAVGSTIDFVMTPNGSDHFDCPFLQGNIAIVPVPEPGMMGIMLVGAVFMLRRRKI